MRDLTIENLTVERAGFDYTKLHTYSGYLTDNEKLLKSASGGAVTAMAEAVIKRGGVVFGAAYSDDFKRSEYKCVDNLDDFEKLKGSKYCETVKEIIINGERKSVFHILKEKINEGRLILFVGLGCDIGAVKAYCQAQNLNSDKLFTVGILCHGPTTAEVHKQYIEDLESKFKSQIKFFSVRYKKEGWVPAYIHAEFKNGKIYEIPFYESDYGFAFSNYSKSVCYQCKFRGDNHKADVICGDFWGLEDSMSGWNENGVSIMFSRTKLGDELINMINNDDYHIEKADTAFALAYNNMYFECRPKEPNYDEFGKYLSEEGLKRAVAHFQVISNKEKLRRFLKDILPNSIIRVLKILKEKFR